MNLVTYCVIMVEETRCDIDGKADTSALGAGIGGMTIGAG